MLETNIIMLSSRVAFNYFPSYSTLFDIRSIVIKGPKSLCSNFSHGKILVHVWQCTYLLLEVPVKQAIYDINAISVGLLVGEWWHVVCNLWSFGPPNPTGGQLLLSCPSSSLS
jgi:hypothetical protein